MDFSLSYLKLILGWKLMFGAKNPLDLSQPPNSINVYAFPPLRNDHTKFAATQIVYEY